MNLFYSTEINNDIAVFDEEEARHCIQVLRKRAGDGIRFADGKGNWYDGQILETGKKSFTAKVVRSWQEQHPPPPLHLAVAPTKSMERFEWLLEKATEIGVGQLTPLLCKHSERKILRPERLERVLLAAMKQSLRATKPVLNEMVAFEKFVAGQNLVAQRYIAHCHSEELPHLSTTLKPAQSVLIMIGPEGDFSEAEVELALNNGFAAISLGSARLRTETAAIAACLMANLKFSRVCG